LLPALTDQNEDHHENPVVGAGINASSLQSGRLPEAGRDEVVAGASAAHKDRVTAGDRVLEVVGVLKPDFALLRDKYVIPPSDRAAALFTDGDPSVHPATLVQLTDEQFQDRTLLHIVIAGSVLVSTLPDVQTILLSNVRDALSASSGPLAWAARAY
jgi:hypothetical protein